MEITRDNLNEAVFFGLAGRLTINARIEGLHDAARDISDPRVGGVFVDLNEVTRLDCWGIGQLILLRGLVVASGRAFGLVNLNFRQRSLLNLLRVSEVCEIYRSRRQAVRSFEPSRSSPDREQFESASLSARSRPDYHRSSLTDRGLARTWRASNQT